MDVKERRRDLPKNEVARIVVDEGALRTKTLVNGSTSHENLTYKTERESRQSGDGVYKCADTKHIQIQGCDDKVPDKVSNSKSSNQATAASVSPHTAISIHVHTFLICKEDPKSDAANEQGLEHGNNMCIPVESFLSREVRIMLRSK